MVEKKRGRPHSDKAVALKYKEKEDLAPKIAAKGRGLLARKIIEIAREHGVPIYEDPDLAAVLMGIELGEVIPPELYRAVAEVLAFVYRMDNRYARKSSL